MKALQVLSLILLATAMSTTNASAQEKKEQKPATLRSVLLEQLITTHNKNDWFVSPSKAVEGLTPEQVSWKDGKGNHSIGQLAYHLAEARPGRYTRSAPALVMVGHWGLSFDIRPPRGTPFTILLVDKAVG